MNWIKNRIFFVLFLVITVKVYCQTGATCSLSKSITVNGTCPLFQAGPLPSPGNTIEAPVLGTCLTTPTTGVRDLWARFQATNATATISVQSNASGAANRNVAFIVYDVPCTCPSGTITNTTELACVNNITTTVAQTETVVLTSLVVGQIYYMRVLGYNSGSTSALFSICINSPQANDEPTSSGFISAPASSCSNIVGNLKNATKTTCGGLATPSCGNYGASSLDVWYEVTVPVSGNLFLQTSSSAMTLMGIAAYTGTPCVGLTPIGCSEGNPEGTTSGFPVLNLQGQVASSTVYVRVWNQDGQTPGTFSICATTNGPCGNNIALNDFCERPYAVFTSGVTSTMVAVGYTGTPVYTEDVPGDLPSSACSAVSAMQNSWYSFVATASSVSIPVTTSTCRVDVELFSVSTNSYGCCKNFTPVSGLDPITPDCATFTWSVAAASSATITATGLTNGQTYYMMTNYPAGACNFSVTGWAYSGVLPVDLISFTGDSEGKYNRIKWIVGSEANIDSYSIEHSHDAKSFTQIGIVQPKISVASNASYEFLDNDFYKDITYYRIKQKLKDGTENYTNIISVSFDNKYDNIINIFPNPTNGDLNFEYYLNSAGIINVTLLDYSGKITFNYDYQLTEGKNSMVLPMSQLERGVYILKITSEQSGKVTHKKIIKN